jgi:hypothetical protein
VAQAARAPKELAEERFRKPRYPSETLFSASQILIWSIGKRLFSSLRIDAEQSAWLTPGRPSILLQHLDGFQQSCDNGTLPIQEVSAVAAIRAVLIGMSPLLRDILAQSISSQANVEIVGELLAHEWGERLRWLSPDVVIISLRRGEGDDITSRLLDMVPNAKIITLS